MTNHTKNDFKPLFKTGLIAATQGAMAAMQGDTDLAALLLLRHTIGDAGDICEEDKKVNADALRHGARIMSAYKLFNDQTIWIITESDRSSTTILTPEEY
jgi:hypothetical protein